MQRDVLLREAQPEALRQRLAQATARPEDDHDHASPLESTRESTYRGHHIVIRTSYRIEVDGRPIEGHLGVSNDGQVHYHAIPNLGFSSALDLVKKVIDTFPEDFGEPYGDDDEPPHGEGGHEHGEGGGEHGEGGHEHGKGPA